MADTKITALTAIGANPIIPSTFPIPMVDLTDTSMAASGTTKKVTVNQILQAGGTATLASATITGDLTVDTSTLKVDSANNRVGIGTASPNGPLDVQANTAATAISIRGRVSSNVGTLRWFQNNGTTETAALESYDTGFEFRTLTAVPSIFITNSTERYRIASDGVATWSNVGGVAGTAMTLNSTGLGVGASPQTKIHVEGTSATVASTVQIVGAATSTLLLGQNADGGVVRGQGGNNCLTFWTGGFASTAASGTGTERMRIDAAGQVGIGVTPSAWSSGLRAINFSTNGVLYANGGNSVFFGNNYYNDGAGTNRYLTNNVAAAYGQVTGAHQWFTAPSGTAGDPISGANAFVQTMTLDASGNLLVGKTAVGFGTVGVESSSSGLLVATRSASTDGASATMMVYSTGAAAYRFYVGMGGTVFATNTTISAISDARLKENVQDIDVGLGAILALKPRKFDWKEGKGKNIKGDRGFIAQEFEQVFPQLVDEWKDEAPEGEAPYKSVRQDLIPVLVKAIQELTARVQTLETR